MILTQVLLKRIRGLLSEKKLYRFFPCYILFARTLCTLPHASCNPSTAFFPTYTETVPNYLLVQKYISMPLQRRKGVFRLFVCLFILLSENPFSTPALMLPTKIPTSLSGLRKFASCARWPLYVSSSQHLLHGILVSCLYVCHPK